jgi:hypothetical protein
MSIDYEITDYNYICSAIGNAYFSGLAFEELWNCISISATREELDASVEATIKLHELINQEKNND